MEPPPPKPYVLIIRKSAVCGTEILVRLCEGKFYLFLRVPPRFRKKCRKTGDKYVIEYKRHELHVVTQTTMSRGIWLLRSDFDRLKVMGFEFARGVCDVVRASVPPCMNRLALYHGTSAKGIRGIIREQAIHTSFGMLGTGVYLARFSKAAGRYARRAADYSIRRKVDGEECAYVVRCVVDPTHIAERAMYGACTCGEYCRGGFAANAKVSDHRSLWMDRGYTGVHATPTRTDRITRTGNVRWIIRNEEWCVHPRVMILQMIMNVIGFTDADGGSYNASDCGMHVE